MGLIDEVIFWGVWILIPLVWEIGIGLSCGLYLIYLKLKSKKPSDLDYFPTISVLIPIYNSSKTIRACLESIAKQDYDMSKVEIRILNNQQCRDESYAIFESFELEHPELKLWWYDTHAGKAKALNRGIISSRTDYVINIDSDGWLDRNGLKALVQKFQSDPQIGALTGVVLIDPELIKSTDNKILQVGQRCEMFEYSESFLVGRNIASRNNSMYTLAGACSAFRRSCILKTNMYNFDTVGEDTDMTFKIKSFTKMKVLLCENCFFYVDPIESLDRMYTQRQRWQRGQLEVAKMHLKEHTGTFTDFFSKSAFRILTTDHTLAFPRLIWMFGNVYLYFVDYPINILIGANILLYLLYVLNSYIYLIVSIMLTDTQRETRLYFIKSWWIIILLPLYRGAIFWIRLAGIINSIDSSATWTTLTLSKEIDMVKERLDKRIFNKVLNYKEKMEKLFYE